MNKNPTLIQLRSKKLGVLLYDRRLSSRRSAEEVSRALDLPLETYLSFENGSSSPTLPVLETIAFYFGIPVEQFWSNVALSEKDQRNEPGTANRLWLLRNKIIGARLKQERTRLNISLEDLSEKTGIQPDELEAYELGQNAPSVPKLELVCLAIGLRIEELFDQSGKIGEFRSQKAAEKLFADLPPDMQEFLSKPINRPYLELAMRLADLSVEKLRMVAEGLLEITY